MPPVVIDYPSPSPSSTAEFKIDYNIACKTELIVKKQTDEEIIVKNSPAHGLIVKGCPKIKERKLYYVWFKRSDNCIEEWMNQAKPFIFEYVSREECNCSDPYLIPKGGSFFENLNPNAQAGEENIWGKELSSTSDPVYIVHMMISETVNPKDAGRKSVGFYDRYLNLEQQEARVQLETNNYSSHITNTTNLYLSPSDQSEENLGSLHLIDVGQNISHVNKIYFNEKIPF